MLSHCCIYLVLILKVFLNFFNRYLLPEGGDLIRNEILVAKLVDIGYQNLAQILSQKNIKLVFKDSIGENSNLPDKL